MKYFAGLDLGGSALKSGFGNSSAGLSFFQRTPYRIQSKTAIYELFASAVNSIKDNLPPSGSLKAIAVGSPGFINHKTGEVVSNCPNIEDWTGANPKSFLEDLFSLPVYVENDANLMAYGEFQISENRYHSLLGITIGSGIGAGFIHNSRIFHGSSFSSAEIGHLIIDPNGRRCNCGKSGCLELYSSVPAIEKDVEKHLKKRLSIETILQIMDSDPTTASIVNSAYEKLAYAIANTITVIDPEIIVIGGGITEIPAFSIDRIQQAVKSFLNPYQRSRLKIVTAKLKNRSAVWGGIVLAEEKTASL